MVLSENEQYDLKFFEELLGVRLHPYFCRGVRDYTAACQRIRENGLKVIVGGSFALDVAKTIGIQAVFSFNEEDILKNAIERALEVYDFNTSLLEKITQMNILLQESNDGLFILDHRNRIALLNKVAEEKFNISKSSAVGEEFHKLFTDIPVKHYLEHQAGEMIAKRGDQNIVLDFHPVTVKERTQGMVVVGRLAQAVAEPDVRYRKRLPQKSFKARYTFDDLIGENPRFKACLRKSRAFSRSASPIMLYGETGSGKEILAQAIHNHSRRKDQAFVAVNCASLPGDLIESELFGYEKGAFTGAQSQGKTGLAELAHRGTLFLDEIGVLDYKVQAKLLRLLQEKEFIRIGGQGVTPVDVRIISATNEDPAVAVDEGRLRKDLFYRLNTLFIILPPLRERKGDILPLFMHWLSIIRPETVRILEKNAALIERELARCSFPGNVRELRNLVERFCLLVEPARLSQGGYLGEVLSECGLDHDSSWGVPDDGSSQVVVKIKADLKSSLKEAERDIIRFYADRHAKPGDLARALGVERSTLWRKLKEHGIGPG